MWPSWIGSTGYGFAEKLDDDAFADRVIEWAVNRDQLKPIIPLVRTRVNKWSDLMSIAGFFLDGLTELSPEQLQFKGLESDEVQQSRLDALEP